MKSPFSSMLYGGDYNPEQWPREIWEQDMRLFDQAYINSASVNIFSWARLQSAEEVYHFSELDDIIEMLTKNNKQIVLATSTAAMPAWMFKKYPEVSRVDYEGRRHKFGIRHNACPHSQVYQMYAERLAFKLAERYGHNPQVVCWHINNEYGGECFCENCEKAFRVWLRNRYKTIEALNEAWNMAFWSHTVYDWDEIVLPNALSDGIGRHRTAFSGISLDYRRFMSDSLLNNFKRERDAIRRMDSVTPITTNLMGTYKGLDYFKWAKEMDIVSWDNYPDHDTPWSLTAMCHDLMRGLKAQPFMLMEQTPSQQNWQDYNSLKRPGQMRAQSYQTIAHGSDTIQFFQLRRSAGACEKFHGALIAHAGTGDTRVFRESTQLGRELAALGDTLLGASNPAQVGIVFDWENYWALEYTSGPSVDLRYVDQIHQYYRFFYDNNIPVNLIPADADFSVYSLIVAPVLYMVKEGMAQRLEHFVKEGGTLVTSFMSGIVNESDKVYPGGYPGPLRKLTGVWVEEIDALTPEKSNGVRFADGTIGSCKLLCDIIHLESAESLAIYTSDFYAGLSVVTMNRFGLGSVYYVGSQLELETLDYVLTQASQTAGTKPLISEKTDLEIVRRRSGSQDFFFVINFSGRALPLPLELVGFTDLLSGKVMGEETVLENYDVLILSVVS